MGTNNQNNILLPNGWENIGVIGRGSSGTVYRAKRTIGRNTEWAAVKHISMPSDPDELNTIRAELGTADENTVNEYLYESLQDMLGEYFQMKTLQGHTNIVACQDIQQIPKAEGIGYDVYIWMELLESLSNRIIEGKMDRDETIRMGMDICQALSLLKSKRIVHRDIKPQNIFVNEHGDYKLGDFGSARGIKGTSTVMSMKGTFSYTAPEIMQGKPAGFTSDIYSLGLVMYRLLNRNRHPFIQEGDISSARGIEDSNFRRFGGEALPMPVDADEELGRIILKACAFEPRNRWQTPEEMYNALAELSEGTTITPLTVESQQPAVPPDTPKPEPPKSSSSKKWRFVGGSIAIALLAVAILGGIIIGRRSVGARTAAAISIASPTPSPTPTLTPTPTPTPTTTPTPTPTPNATSAQTPTNPYASISVGDTFLFGKYEQDNDASNGKEDIEWLVLAKEGSRALLISKYALDCQPYNTTKTGVTWETCSLRKWLNESFLNSAFSKSEQNMIITATIKADMNPYFITEPGNDTRDKIFILSIKEAIQYLDNYEARKCAPTYYAIAQGAATSNECYKDGRAACWWWLRSPGYDSIVAARVDCDGSVFSEGRNVNLNVVAVRPALWINSSTFSAPLSDDPNALTAPTAEMVAGAAEGKLIKSGVNMRQGPSTDTAILATGLKSGTMVTVYAEDGDFYFLQVNETKKYGYIAKSYVKLLSALGETSTGNDQPEGTVRGTISSSNLALREGPGVTYKSLEQYYEGKLVYIFYQEGDYYYVLVAGTELKGYMPAQFITAEGPVPNKDS